MTSPLYANAVYLMANNVVLSLLGFAFWTVVTRFYAEVDVGFASASISALSLIAMLSLVGLDLSIIRFLPQEKKPQELINSYFTLTAIISVVAVGIFTAGLDLWSPSLSFIKGNAIFCVVFIATAILGALSRLIDNVFIAKRKAGFTLLKNIIFSVLKIPLPILFTLFFHSFGIIASWGISLGIAVVVSLLFFLPRVQNHYKLVPTLNLNRIRGIWRYSGGNYLASLLTTAPATVLPMMVVNILGPVQNAYFYIAWMVATLLFTIPLGVSQSLFAEGSHFEDKLRENVIKSAKFTFLLLVPAVILVILVGRWILPSKYHPVKAEDAAQTGRDVPPACRRHGRIYDKTPVLPSSCQRLSENVRARRAIPKKEVLYRDEADIDRNPVAKCILSRLRLPITPPSHCVR